MPARETKQTASETSHQIAVIRWTQQPEIRARWPELKLLYHIANERICTPQQGKLLRRMGLRRGVPDLHLSVARGPYHSLYIEMKTETGKTAPDQDWWGEQLSAEGNYCEVCHGWESAVRVLEWYLSLPKEALAMAEFTWPWEQDAMAGREMPDGLSLPDQAAYTAMRNIYESFHRKAIPRDVASAEKRKVRRSYEQLVEGMAFQDRLAAYSAKLNKATELAKAAVLKDPTPENALRLVRIMDGLERP